MQSVYNRYRHTIKPPLGAQVNAGHPLAQGLVLCVPMLDGGGRTVTDLSFGPQANGSFVGTLPWAQTSLGLATQLNGSNGNRISFLNPPKLQFTGASSFSIHLLVTKDGGDGTLRYLFTNDNNTGTRDLINCRFHDTSNQLVFAVGNSSQLGTVTGATAVTAAASTPRSLCFVRDTQADQLRIYLDGKEDGVATDASSTSWAAPNDNWTTGTPNGIVPNGKYIQILVWNRVVTPAEIQELYVDPFVLLRGRKVWKLSSVGSLTEPISPTATLSIAGGLIQSLGQHLAGSVSPTGALIKQPAKGFGGTEVLQGAVDCGYPDTFEANSALQNALRSLTIAHWPNTEADLVMRHLARKQRETELDLCVPISLVNLYRACGLTPPSVADIVTLARREGLAPEGIGEANNYGGIWPIDAYYLLGALGFPYGLHWIELSSNENVRDAIKPLVDSGCRVLGFFDRVVEGPGRLCAPLGLDSDWEQVPFYSAHCGLLYETAADYVKVLTGDWNEPIRPLPWLVKFTNQTLASVRLAFRPGFIVTEPLPPLWYQEEPGSEIRRAFERKDKRR